MRMGTDKALVEFGGQPLVARALDILRGAGLSVSIAGSRTAALAAYAPIVPDAQTARGPLAGICAALASTSAPRAAFLSVDAPLIPVSLLTYLLHHAQTTDALATLVSVNGFTQTFPAILDRRAIQSLHQSLLSGHSGCFKAFKSACASLAMPLHVLPVERLIQSGQVAHPAALPAYLWFTNINNQDDLTRAEHLFHAPQGLI